MILEQIKNNLGLIASIITSITVIGSALLYVGKKILKKTFDDKLEPFNERIDNLEEARVKQHEETKEEISKIRQELDKNSLNTMKNTICNDNIPISERLLVGKEYLDKGGNGAVKVLLHKLADEYEEQLKEGKL